MPSSSSSGTVWGKMVGAIGTGIKITASAVVFLFTSLVLYNFGAELLSSGVDAHGFGETVSELWKTAVGAAGTAWTTMEGFFNDLLTLEPVEKTWNWLGEAYTNNKDAIHIGAGAVGVGALGYGAYKWSQSHKSSLPPPRLPANNGEGMNYHEFRHLKERLDMARASHAQAR